MIVYAVNVVVKPGCEDDFIRATKKNHEMTRQEPGNVRFDCLQLASEKGRFLLYEAYVSEEAVTDHKNTAHYREWKNTVEPFMAVPRQGLVYAVVCPEPGPAWKSGC